MKILIVNSHYSKGGASRAALRLRSALEQVQVDCEYMSIYEQSPSFFQSLNFKFRAAIDRIPGLISARKNIMFSSGIPYNSSLITYINSCDADIVHFHWINSGGLSVSDLSRITKPIVFSLHDMWLFTGGCHYDKSCGRYSIGCGECPILKSDKNNDLSYKNLRKKERVFEQLQSLSVIGLSKWMATEAKKSTPLKNHKVVHLPNPIDVNFYKPIDKNKARSVFNLPYQKKLILFGAMSALDDPRKGYEKLIDALSIYEHTEDIELVVFGNDKPIETLDNAYNTHYMGYINDDEDLKTLYCAADVMLVPSLQENLSNAIMESMSCGTPVVAFNIGGNSDMIDHKINGFLATPLDSQSLSEGIKWVIDSSNSFNVRQNARSKIQEKFSLDIVGNEYKFFYNTVYQSIRKIS